LASNGTVESEIWKAPSFYAFQSRLPNRLSVQQGGANLSMPCHQATIFQSMPTLRI
jgi:hypothetical protein